MRTHLIFVSTITTADGVKQHNTTVFHEPFKNLYAGQGTLDFIFSRQYWIHKWLRLLGRQAKAQILAKAHFLPRKNEQKFMHKNTSIQNTKKSSEAKPVKWGKHKCVRRIHIWIFLMSQVKRLGTQRVTEIWCWKEEGAGSSMLKLICSYQPSLWVFGVILE